MTTKNGRLKIDNYKKREIKTLEAENILLAFIGFFRDIKNLKQPLRFNLPLRVMLVQQQNHYILQQKEE